MRAVETSIAAPLERCLRPLVTLDLDVDHGEYHSKRLIVASRCCRRAWIGPVAILAHEDLLHDDATSAEASS
jgi:hypothetical protein